MHIHLPPLRERTSDIRQLCELFLSRTNQTLCELSESLVDALARRPWHGNVRELRNAVERAAVVARGRALHIEDFPQPLQQVTTSGVVILDSIVRQWALTAIADQHTTEPLHSRFLAAAEPALLQVAMEHTAGNRAKAAEILGIHRGTLRERLRAYRLEE